MSTASDSQAGTRNPKAQTFFQKGNEAAQKANFDYAIQMYQEACKIDPGHLIYRQALRLTERRKFGNDPAKVGRLVGMHTQPIRMKARAAKSKGQYAHAIEVCEEAFAHNPWDVGAAREAAEAAEQLGLKEVALWILESVHAVATDAAFFRYLAHIQEINSCWNRAIASWERVKKIDPYDEDSSRKINALSANSTIQRSGLNEALNKRPSGTSGPEPLAPELEELKQPQLSPEERWQKEIQENPEQIGPYLNFADHLRNRGQLDDAEKLLARAMKVVPNDASLQLAHAEVQVARLQRAIASWGGRSRARPDDAAAKAKLDQLQTMLADYETKEYRRRIALHPGDLNLQYELGLRLARTGQHKDAIAAFQQARSSPALKVQALHQTGLSFEAEGALKLAERSYLEALKAADAEDVSLTNALHYRLGRVSEAIGNTQMAEEHYNEVAANDYGYLDVAQRLRALS